MAFFWLLLFLGFSALTVVEAPLILWIFFLFCLLVYQSTQIIYFGLLFIFFFFFTLRPIRRFCLTQPIMWFIKKFNIFPRVSATEKTALEAGKTWVEKEFFSGKPNFRKLIQSPLAQLSEEEEEFINDKVQTLCRMIDDWKIYKTRKIPFDVENYIKENKFLGISIPTSFGGLGFSHYAHSRILEMVCSRSYAVGIYIMVPNSLGPGELLLHYGTEKQKNHYLPRLALGQEIPCFGLTEPEAGSDASSISSYGVLFKDDQGDLKIKLNWNKRWITLAPQSTLLGIAFQLEDPERILGQRAHIGITCALVPAHFEGVKIGERHDPMSIPFPNGPTQGENVIISVEEHIIGGIEKVGQGWQMLMDCLGTGRGISLPSSGLASAKLLIRVTAQHCVVRQQFGLSIGKFEGVSEKLSEMGGWTFISQAVLSYTLSALNRRIPSALCSAISKYQITELSRKVISNGMDILAGSGLSMGPRNISALSYIGAPIAITVEGANILTRSFIIFGQGFLRAHPYAYKEIKAFEEGNSLKFDQYFWSHIGHVIKNIVRCIYLSLTRGLLIFVPRWRGRGIRIWQKIAWASAVLAVLSEVASIVFGGKLKIKEKITGRFADALMGLYMASSIMWYWKSHNKNKELWPFVEWGASYSLHQVQKSFEDILYNFDYPVLSFIFRNILIHICRFNRIDSGPSDKLSNQISKKLLENSDLLDQLTSGIYFADTEPNSHWSQMNQCYKWALQAIPIEKKIKLAINKKQLKKKRIPLIKDEALSHGVITTKEHRLLSDIEDLRRKVIQVDSFSLEEYSR